MENFDVIVIGAGVAGIAAATALARSRRSVLVIDAGSPRNAPSASAHNVLGMEAQSPQEILRQARGQAENYHVRFSSDRVTDLSGSLDSGFTVSCAASTYGARRILLATGTTDILPNIPGLKEAWGKSLLHCPYCHGWEVRDQRIAILGVDAMSVHQAQLFSQLSEQVTYINHAPEMLGVAERELLAALEIPIIDAQIDSLQVDSSGVLSQVLLGNGEKLAVDAAVVMSRLEANAALYQGLGGVLSDHPMGTHIAVNPMGATEIPGIYAAGNLAEPGAMLLASAASGVSAGAGMNYDLIAQKVASRNS